MWRGYSATQVRAIIEKEQQEKEWEEFVTGYQTQVGQIKAVFDGLKQLLRLADSKLATTEQFLSPFTDTFYPFHMCTNATNHAIRNNFELPFQHPPGYYIQTLH
jgi:hypothetical protein